VNFADKLKALRKQGDPYLVRNLLDHHAAEIEALVRAAEDESDDRIMEALAALNKEPEHD
jgi:thioester reductase-like protein